METPITALKTFILANWNTYISAASTVQVPLAQLAAVNLCCGYLDPDSRPDDLAVFILPDVETYEPLSIETNMAECQISAYIIVRGGDQELIFTKAMRYGESMQAMIAEHCTLGGTVAEIQTTLMDFFWGIDGDQNTKAVKIDFIVNYES
jgi:hypothetical protein